MTPSPPPRRDRSTAGRLIRPAVVLALVALAGCAAGCAPGPGPVPAPRSVVLAGRPGSATLVLVSTDGAVRELELPATDATWLAADAAGRLVLTLADGKIVRTDRPAGDGRSRWLPVTVGGSASAPEGPLAFAVPDGPGGRVAALEASFGSGAPASLVLIDLAGRGSRAIPLGREAQGSAPAWLAGDRLAAIVLDPSGGPSAVLVDAASAEVRPGRQGVAAIAASSDGSRIATVGADGRSVEIRSGAAWPGAGPWEDPPVARIGSPAIGIAAAVALDPAGRSLAVVWTDGELVARSVVRYDAAVGWRETSRYPLPEGTLRAAVAFVPGVSPAGPSGASAPARASCPRAKTGGRRRRPPSSARSVRPRPAPGLRRSRPGPLRAA